MIRRDGVGAPELLVGVRTPVTRGQRFEQALEFELFDRRATGGEHHSGGFVWDEPLPPVGVGRGKIEIEGRLASSRLGLAGIGHGLTASWRPNVLRTTSREGFRHDNCFDQALFPVGSVGLQDLGALLEWKAERDSIIGCRHGGALLLRFEEADGRRDRTWSLGEWVEALHLELGETLLEAAGEKLPYPRGWTGVREDQGKALCYFPAAGLEEELKTFVDSLESGSQRDRELERHLVAARLLNGESYGLVLLAVLLRFWSRRLERRPWPSLLILVALCLQEFSPLSPRGDLLLALSDTSFVAAVAMMVVIAGRRGAWGLRWPAAAVYFPAAGQQLWVRYLCAFDELERATRIHAVSVEWTLGGIGMVAAVILTVGFVSAATRPNRAVRLGGRVLRAPR